jgi:hypothetical protein
MQDSINNWRTTSLILTTILFPAAGIWFIGMSSRNLFSNCFNISFDMNEINYYRNQVQPNLQLKRVNSEIGPVKSSSHITTTVYQKISSSQLLLKSYKMSPNKSPKSWKLFSINICRD